MTRRLALLLATWFICDALILALIVLGEPG